MTRVRVRFIAALTLLTSLCVQTAAADTIFGPWRHLGPNGAAVTGIVFDPVFPKVVVVSTTGGVYRSVDTGDSWRIVGDWGATPALAGAPSNHLVFYASSQQLGLVMKSSDGGVTWSAAGASAPGVFNALAVDPVSSQVVYGTLNGGTGGLFRSIDGGVTWLRIPQIVPTASLVFHGVRIDPANPTTVYAFGSSIFKSSDGGASWIDVKPVVTGANTAVPAVAYALEIDPRDSRVLTAAYGVWGVYRSTDGGSSWVLSDSGIPGPRGGVALLSVSDLGVDPRNPSTLYASAFCPGLCTSGRVFKSTDSGVTWIDTGMSGGWAPVMVAVSRSTTATVLVGFDCEDSTQGPNAFNVPIGSHSVCTATLLRSGNGGGSWTETSKGLSAMLVLDILFDPVHAQVGYAATGRGPFKTIDGGNTWVQSGSTLPEGFAQQSTLAIGNNGSAVYVTQNSYGLFKSTDAGASWTAAGSNPVSGINLPAINALAADPGSDTVYAGTPFGMFRTVDGAQTWTQFATGSVTALAYRPGNPSVLIYALATGITYRSFDGGTTLTPLSLRNVTKLALDPSDPQTLYATATVSGIFSCGMTKTELFRSTDNGSTWTYVSDGPVSSAPNVCSAIVLSLAVDPSNPARLAEAVFTGPGFSKPVYLSSDRGVTWTAVSGTLTASVRTVAFNGSALFGGTNGQSLVASNPSCPVQVTADAAPVSASGGPGTLTIHTNGDCGWSAESGSPVLSLQTASGSGDATVAYVAAANGGAPRSLPLAVNELPVFLDQRGSDAGVFADTAGLHFTATTTATGFASASPPQQLPLSQTTDSGSPWTITTTQPWLGVSPAAGAGAGSATVALVSVAGLQRTGELTGSIIVQTYSPSFAQQTIPATLDLIPASTTPEPFGAVDTPVDLAAGLQGSIAMTGWALDDVAVTGVRIVRDAVAGEPGGPIFIGNATLIDGARPDVAAAFSSWPHATRAGWGYLLLSNMLPAQGNGVFRFTVIADDADGHSTVIGVRTIVCDNAHATAPFGAIDTPGQGAVVSGIVPNFGWVLSPGSGHADPPDGGTVTVFVDGTPVGSPAGWASRTDLSTLFPVTQYQGVESALGVYGLDTTTLTNGVHTISWAVTDDIGTTSGIGSRFFTVSNGAIQAAGIREQEIGKLAAGSGMLKAESWKPGGGSWQPGAGGVLLGRIGFDLATPLDYFFADGHGVITIDARELDRIELHLEPGARGVMITPQGEKPLPLGARIDPVSGQFTWAPPAGYVGAYNFVLGSARVRIVLRPKSIGGV